MDVNDNDYVKNYLGPRGARSKQFTAILITREDFQSDVQAMRDKWGIPPEGFATNEDAELWLAQYEDARATEKKFIDDLSETFIRSGKYNLGSVSWHPLKLYILTNDKNGSFSGLLPKVVLTRDEHSGEAQYNLRFYGHTTEAEMRQAFNSFKASAFPDKRPRLIAPVKLKKMQMAYELRSGGMAWKQVAETVNNKLGGNLQYNDARKLVEQYKKYLEE